MHLTVHRLQRQKRFVTKYSAAKEARVESRAEQREEERVRGAKLGRSISGISLCHRMENKKDITGRSLESN